MAERRSARGSDQARCRALIEELSAYQDGELPPARMRALERHLADCPCCRQVQARLKRTATICRESGGPSVPAAVRRRARARARQLTKSLRLDKDK